MHAYPGLSLQIGGSTVSLGRSPLILGIVNVTPDSFSDGGAFFDPKVAVMHAKTLVAEGADWLDVGGESTRPGATPTSADEELRRVLPVLEQLNAEVTVPISIDTYKPLVARRALELGVSIVNDVTGFRDPEMIRVVADSAAACVCMHMKGTPETMRDLASYQDLIGEMLAYFEERMASMEAGGIARERIVVDPGIGFAKKLRHNVEILSRLGEFRELGRPVLLGASRKRILGELTGRSEPDRLAGTIASAVVGYLNGANILRVHDVAPVRDALAVASAIASCEPMSENRSAT